MIWRDPVAAGPADGRLVVLVHGTMDRATSFTRLMAKLPDWTILTYDRRGYAGSSRAGPPAGFDQQVEDLCAVLAERARDRPAVAFGHSFGGDVVLAALASPSASSCFGGFTGAMVWEPPQPWLPWWPDGSVSRGAGSDLDPEDRAEWFMRRMVGDRVWERLPGPTRQRRRAEGPTLEAELRSLSASAPFDPARVKLPVIAGRGGRSRPHQRRGVRELAAALALGELAEIPEADHMAHLSHPGEVAGLIRRLAGDA